ncbi:hypothetical protein Tco_0409239 [Tanacetum coccineum]
MPLATTTTYCLPPSLLNTTTPVASKQPWSGMNAMQVVDVVRFQHRRLEIPNEWTLATIEQSKKGHTENNEHCRVTEKNLLTTAQELEAARCDG